MKAHILIVEDDKDMCLMLKESIEVNGYHCSYIHSGLEAKKLIDANSYDIVITDYNIPEMNGIQLCKHISEHHPKIAVIVITAFGTMDTAVEALRNGAYDFISKPFDLETILHTLKRTSDFLDLSIKIKSFQEAESHSFEGIIGQSKCILSLIDKIKVFAQTDTSILISGESGTGKEVIARAIHNSSPRKNSPFIPINCSALSETLLESELFGHVQGAFTDAKSNRKGLFQNAGDGTIFLDEIGDMPIKLQAKLLRALEERKVRPVGSDKSYDFNARILSATNCDLAEAIENKTFREDLYYRINVIELKVPPLRERSQDIILLAQSFINSFCVKYSKRTLNISKKTHEIINGYPWPGNVRELKNSLEHAVIVCQNDSISPSDLPSRITNEFVENIDDKTPLSVVERNHILKVFNSTGGNKEESARILKMSKRTLYRRLEEYSKSGFL